ncbi:MAG: DUF1028 domain-containing protein [Acidobacteria bacterium]|nr:DUF1028 domain-containing protein [Acidobacteriota bacterium]
MKVFSLMLILLVTAAVGCPVNAAESATRSTLPPEPAGETLFATFSLCAIDPATGECGVAVTTRVPFVGRAVPWVEAGVGAVATQSWTVVEYGRQGLDLLKEGVAPAEALKRMLAEDKGAQLRQLGIINMKGETAAFTGDECGAWAGSRQGENYTVQGNILVGPEVISAVAEHFEWTAGSGMPLAERMIRALEAGQESGGDKRWGYLQSAAIKIADPNHPGRGGDHISLAIEVGEHPAPVAELKRIYFTTARRFGYRQFSEIRGNDVLELKRMLHTLGYWHPELEEFPEAPKFNVDEGLRESNPEEYRRKVEEFRQAREAYMDTHAVFDAEAVAAVDAFRKANDLEWEGNPRGLVDERFIRELWMKHLYHVKPAADPVQETEK